MTEIETPITDTHDEVWCRWKQQGAMGLGLCQCSQSVHSNCNHYFASDDVGIQTIQNIGINKQQLRHCHPVVFWDQKSWWCGFCNFYPNIRWQISEYILMHTNESVDNQDSKMWFQVQFVQILQSMFEFGAILIMAMCGVLIFSEQILVMVVT